MLLHLLHRMQLSTLPFEPLILHQILLFRNLLQFFLLIPHRLQNRCFVNLLPLRCSHLQIHLLTAHLRGQPSFLGLILILHRTLLSLLHNPGIIFLNMLRNLLQIPTHLYLLYPNLYLLYPNLCLLYPNPFLPCRPSSL